MVRGKNQHLVEKNRALLLTEEGNKEYQKRMYTVEPVFGNIKSNMGFRHFLLRGISKVKGEFSLMCIVHNIKKIAKFCEMNNVSFDSCFA